MKKIDARLLGSPLFAGIREDELQSLLQCVRAVYKTFAKGETVFFAGDAATQIGVVCAGAVQIFRDESPAAARSLRSSLPATFSPRPTRARGRSISP